MREVSRLAGGLPKPRLPAIRNALRGDLRPGMHRGCHYHDDAGAVARRHAAASAQRAGRAIAGAGPQRRRVLQCAVFWQEHLRSEEHTSELQSLMRISYAVFCLKKKTKHTHIITN